jgi:hypothetical protein
MFAARQRPLLVVEDRLLALRLSLNTPVLSTAELATGPARAAIVVYAEAGTRRFAVIARSLRGGVAVVYELEAEPATDESGWNVALDAALSFGESMGFLFDDEMVVDRRPETLRRALARMHALIAPPEVGDLDEISARADTGSASDAPRAAASEEPGPVLGSSEDLSEILLEDEFHGLDAASRAPEPVPSPEPAVALSLSKFRGAPPPAPVTAPASLSGVPLAAASPEQTEPGRTGPARLGRVRPLRVRLDGDGAPKIDPILRLLADF